MKSARPPETTRISGHPAAWWPTFATMSGSAAVPDLDVIEDVVALHGIDLAVRTQQSPERVYLAPEQWTLDFTFERGMTRCSVPEVRGHQIVVFEGSP